MTGMAARSLFHNRRGVSEIIASLILVLIVTAAGTVAYSMSLSSFNQSSSLFELQTGQREEQAQERFAVIAVSWDTANQLNLTVLNYGKTDLTVDAVYVSGTAVTNYQGGRGVKIGALNLVFVGFNSSTPILAGQTYDILVVSERGSRNEIFWEA
jgi:flagellin-like protein